MGLELQLEPPGRQKAYEIESGGRSAIIGWANSLADDIGDRVHPSGVARTQLAVTHSVLSGLPWGIR